jgi:hypothetical protein
MDENGSSDFDIVTIKMEGCSKALSCSSRLYSVDQVHGGLKRKKEV